MSTGRPEPLKLRRPPVEGVGKRSLARLSITPSCDSEPLVAKDKCTGCLSLGRPDPLTTSEEARKQKEQKRKLLFLKKGKQENRKSTQISVKDMNFQQKNRKEK